MGQTGELVAARLGQAVVLPRNAAFRRLPSHGDGTCTFQAIELRRLKMERYLETFSAPSPAGPPRQYYRLTDRGRERLTAVEAEWVEAVRAVDRCLYKGVTS